MIFSMDNLIPIVIGYLVFINLFAVILFAVDKSKARKGQFRIPEATLITIAACGGSIGALLAMKLCHHKTRKPKFAVGIPAILILQLALAGYIAWRWFI